MNLTKHWGGYVALIVFLVAYVFVMLEEVTHIQKSKPVMLAAGIIWGMIGLIYAPRTQFLSLSPWRAIGTGVLETFC